MTHEETDQLGFDSLQALAIAHVLLQMITTGAQPDLRIFEDYFRHLRLIFDPIFHEDIGAAEAFTKIAECSDMDDVLELGVKTS